MSNSENERIPAETKNQSNPQYQDRNAVGDKPNNAESVDGLGLSKVNPSSADSSQALIAKKPGNMEVEPIYTKRSTRYLRFCKYYLRHPYFRILIAYGVTICNFFIYAEDPVAHSYAECTIPAIGNDYAFVASRYPPNGFSALKVILYLIAIFLGLIVGKLIIHRLLLRRLLKLSMFANDQGTWMIMFFCSLISLLLFSFIYNGFLGLSASNAPYKITSYMGIKNYTFMKAAAMGTWMGDFVTAWMVTDMMLQETAKYPNWATGARKWWNRRWNRVILFWLVLVVLTAIVASAIISDYIRWDSINKDFIHTSEIGRGYLASFILVMDLLIVMQDWDFPMFETNFDIKLPGINTAHIHFEIPAFLRKEHWTVHITGKWFNYGIIFMVMILDLNMWKNQIFYSPYAYGQYVGPNGKIYSVKNQTFLAIMNKTTLTYDWRWSHPNTNSSYGMSDVYVNSRFRDHKLAFKATAFIPSLLAFVAFGLFIWLFGRNDEVESIETLKMNRMMTVKKITNISIKRSADDEDGAVQPPNVPTGLVGDEEEEKRQKYGSTASASNVIVVGAVDDNDVGIKDDSSRTVLV